MKTIPVPKGPHGLVVTPDGRKVYVSSDGHASASVIDTAMDQVVRTIDVGRILARIDLDVVMPAKGPVSFFCKFHGPLGQQGQLVIDDR